MTDVLIPAVAALLAIAAATALEPRLGVAAPLLLVLGGIVASLFPFVDRVQVEPEVILMGVLPPLLYAASRSMPTMDFRRELTPIAGLSVLLVVASAFVLGPFFALTIPGVDLAVRSRIPDATVSTVISFTAPFIAAIEAEELGASGLVAAVMAGLVTSQDAPRRLSPRQRLSDAVNWRTIALVLEGGLFLLVGLELSGVLEDVRDEQGGVGSAIAIAVSALVLTCSCGRRSSRRCSSTSAAGRSAATACVRRSRPCTSAWKTPRRWPGTRAAATASPARIERLQTRLRRLSADIDFFLSEPLDLRAGAIIVWAGMRGAVTVAAAQTLPGDAPSRSLLVFVAFVVAVGSLLIQGGTLARLIRAVGPDQPDPEVAAAEHAAIRELLRAATPAGSDGRPVVARIEAQRAALLDARDGGRFSATALNAALVVLDAEQINIELRTAPD